MYKDNMTNELKSIWQIREELKEFLSNGHEFDEYADDEQAYIKDWYREV
jgi:hypothetical protein